MIKTVNFKIPHHWVVALVNGDFTDMSDEEEKALDQFVDDGLKLDGASMFHCIGVSSDVHFTKYHDAVRYGVLPCDVSICTFQIA